jgi:hypothetical protein
MLEKNRLTKPPDMKILISKLIPVLLALFSLDAVAATTRYVNLNNPSPAPPYLDWSTAATNIQHAVDAAAPGDEIVVTNGVYQTGGKVMSGSMTNRVAVNKPLIVRSVNGPTVTVIRGFRVPGTTNGNSAVRCVYLTNGAALYGFTLTNGATRSSGNDVRERSGGGVWCESAAGVVSNCVLSGNSAHYLGAGAYSGTLNNCTLTGNSANFGGGASVGTLNNCTITSNSANAGGGGAFV